MLVFSEELSAYARTELPVPITGFEQGPEPFLKFFILLSDWPGTVGPCFHLQGDRRDLDMSGERFLCGTQITDADGWVEFNSVYPGWYSSRAAHIHFTVSLGDGRTATSQMYFPEHVNTSAFAGPLTTRVTRVPSPTERTSSLVAI